MVSLLFVAVAIFAIIYARSLDSALKVAAPKTSCTNDITKDLAFSSQ
jgi:hypothetical protein